jgi:hypothetical protein
MDSPYRIYRGTAPRDRIMDNHNQLLDMVFVDSDCPCGRGCYGGVGCRFVAFLLARLNGES